MSKKNFAIRDCAGCMLHAALHGVGAPLPKACGGSVCGGCVVRIISGEVEIGGRKFGSGDEVKSCLSKILSDSIEVEMVKAHNISNIQMDFLKAPIPSDTGKTGMGAALDIGTTTVAVILFDLHNGEILARDSFLNPQTAFGGDVITRIAYASTPESLARIRGVLLNAIEESLLKLLKSANAGKIDAMYVAGNTVMLHIFFGEDPSPLGRSPWTPRFLESKTVSGKDFFKKSRVDEIVSLPCISAFVGADLGAACALTGLLKDDKNILLVDVGTNAEMILKIGGKLYCTSAAAGPALEGWGLSNGMRAAVGAVSAFKIENGKLSFETIGGAKPAGICGTGYIDFLACARKLGMINAAGRFTEACGNLVNGESGKSYLVADGVSVSEHDISSILKAKAAVRAGVEALFKRFSISACDLDKFYIAGGFGKNINMKNACAIGFLPEISADKIRHMGNSSLGGTYLCALSDQSLFELKGISKKFTNIELNLEADFEDDFIDNLFLP